MKTLIAATLLLVSLVVPASAGESLQVYGGGSKLATLCASIQMYDNVSFSGFIDLNRDNSWFSKTHLVKDTGRAILATELRASSSGFRQLAISVQLTAKDKAGAFQVNPWYDEDGNWVLSVSQSHKLTPRLWTCSWTDFFSHKEAKGTIRVGYKENAHLDTFAEYRFNTQTRDNGIFAGINLH